nr:MAG TPA: hypothetical protein [Caudoviricetes sp.]
MRRLDAMIIEAARARSKAREGEEMNRAYEHFLRMGDIKSAIRRYKA